MDATTRIAMQGILDDLRTGVFTAEMAGVKVEEAAISPAERAERLEIARRRLAHYEKVGDSFFASLERESIARLKRL